VFAAAAKVGIKLSWDKTVIAQPVVDFAGWTICKDGISANKKMLQALQEFPTPKDKTELRLFFGLAKQLAIFTDQKATMIGPLKFLLKKEQSWFWDGSLQKAFEEARRQLSLPSKLAYYDPTKELELHSDASRLNGMGFILMQLESDGTKRVLEAGSRVCSDAKTRYSIPELELAGVV
jgi:hypothetical protein